MPLQPQNTDLQAEFFTAVKTGDTGKVKIFLKNPAINVNSADNDGKTALIHAVQNNNVYMVETLLIFAPSRIDLLEHQQGDIVQRWAKSKDYVQIIDMLKILPKVASQTKDMLREQRAAMDAQLKEVLEGKRNVYKDKKNIEKLTAAINSKIDRIKEASAKNVTSPLARTAKGIGTKASTAATKASAAATNAVKQAGAVAATTAGKVEKFTRVANAQTTKITQGSKELFAKFKSAVHPVSPKAPGTPKTPKKPNN